MSLGTELDNEAFKQLISLNKTAILSKCYGSFTWWGKRFIEALEEFTDSARRRGRSYASGGKILEYKIKQNYRERVNQSLFWSLQRT